MDSFNAIYKKVFKESFGEEEELDALGVEDSDDFDLGEDFGDEEGDEVTLTLDKATAEKLLEVIQAAVGGEEESEDEFGEEGGEEEGDEFGLDFEEDEEEVADTDVVAKNKDMLVKGKVKPKKRTADSKYTDKTGTEKGKENIDNGKQNKVGKLKAGQEFFS